MEIRHLRTLIAISDCGGFGKAADVIGLTQSAVSQQVRAMEDQLRIRLFDRSVRPPALTTHGKLLADGAREIVKRYEQITSELTGDRLMGTIEIGAVRTALTGVLPPALSILRERYPRLRFQVYTGDSVDLAARVVSGRLDAAIVPGETPNIDGLFWRPFATEPLMVIAHQTVVGTDDKSLLEDGPYIRFTRDVPIAQAIEQEISRRDIHISEAMQIDSFAAIILMVSHGLGVSVVPEQSIVQPYPETVRAVPFGRPPLSRTIGTIEKDPPSKPNLVETLHREMLRLSGSVSN